MSGMKRQRGSPQGGRRPTGGDPGQERGRFSARPKMDAVLRLLRGEELDALYWRARLDPNQRPAVLGTDCSAPASVEGHEATTALLRPSEDSPAVGLRRSATERDGMRVESAEAELEFVLRAWPELPHALRVAILAMIRTLLPHVH